MCIRDSISTKVEKNGTEICFFENCPYICSPKPGLTASVAESGRSSVRLEYTSCLLYTSTVTSIYTYLQPVLAIAVSVAMGLDRLHFDTLVFAAVIFTGVGLVLRSYAGKSRAAEGPDAGPH